MTSKLARVLAAATFLLALLPAASAAQQPITVSGRVTNEANAPMQNVTVSIPQAGVATYTNAEGRYSLSVPAARAGQTVTITARRLGLSPRSVEIVLSGATVTQDFALAPSAMQLEGVVVTALGIERSKKALGVAQQTIDSSMLLIVTASSWMPRTHEPSHGAGHNRPVKSGKLFVACRRSMAGRQRCRYTRSFQSGM